MKKVSTFIKALVMGIGVSLVFLVPGMAAPKRGGDFISSASHFPRHFNSAIASGTATGGPASQIFVSLVLINENYQPVPYLAKSWKMASDGLSYTFYLHEGTEFHDGKPVTSKDVAFSIMMTKKNHPFGPYMFGAVDKVETPDKYTVVIRLKNHHPALMIALNMPFTPILPEHVYGEHAGPIRKNPANIQAIGSGPFKMKEYNPGKNFILERFDKFELLRPGRPYLDRYIVKKIHSPSSALIAISRGEIHFYADGDPLVVTKLKQQKSLWVTDKLLHGVGSVDYIEFNLRNKYLKDKRVRQAIAYALDMDYVTKRLHRGLTKKALGPIVSASPLFSSQVNHYSINLEKARSLLDEAGFKPGSDGIRFSLNMTYFPGAIPYAQKLIAEYAKPQLKKIGIKMNIVPAADFMSYYRMVAKWEHDLITNNIFMWGDPVIGIHRLYMSDNIKHQLWTNTAGYSNKQVDEILNKAGATKDLNQRQALYSDFLKIVMDELPLYFTIEDQTFGAYHQDLRDLPNEHFIWAMYPFDGVYWKDGKTP